MLQTYFFPQVQQQEDIYFQQDGVQHIMLMVFVNGLTLTFMTNGLVDLGHLNGQHIHLIYLQWTFSYGVFLKT